ncbi:uncharacterized protein RJT21DRAFT_83725 [Scheffersomyces amazonensis]|uniref:uncharacterized protein n=1 Tax=Scheffersomyces amazonensis TaxID=1078765 RepID=UPI00315D5D90
MSVRTFLKSLKSQLESNSLKLPYQFVTGNQSADLDSVISAVSYSYLSNVENNTSYIIPLINIPKTDLKLRRDIELLLKTHSIDEDLLYFIEDFEQLVNTKEITHVILVDHCNIQGDILTKFLNQGKLKITSIIDHHDDEKVFLDANPRIIHSNGSCSSLVFKYWYQRLNENKSLFKHHSEILQLLLGPLLIDTSNMTQKVEEGDVFAFTLYKELLTLDVEQFTTKSETFTSNEQLFNEFYKSLKTAKKDLSGFKFEDILRKDYKQFKFTSNENVGFSSIGKSLHWVFKTYTAEDIHKTLSTFLKTFNLDLLIITSSYTQKENDKYTREFCYYYEGKGNTKFDNLNELAREPLQLNQEIYKIDKLEKRLENVQSLGGVLQIYNQVNIKASRKQVVPIVKEILEKDN